MSSLMVPNRVLPHQLSYKASRFGCHRAPRASCWSRIIFNQRTDYSNSRQPCYASAAIIPRFTCRTYATQPGKPKAHTGRAAASTRKPAVAISDAIAGTPKKAGAKRGESSEKSTGRSPSKPKARKTRPKTKPKTKRKTKAKAEVGQKKKGSGKRPTEKQKGVKAKQEASKKLRELRSKALFTTPKELPATAWLVLSCQPLDPGTTLSERSKIHAAQYKTLSLEERERLNHVANENKAQNEAAFEKWLNSHTPAEIRQANLARRKLARQSKKRIHLIHDERLIKGRRNPFMFFFTDRIASGDFKHMKVGEMAKLAGSEWRALSEAEKKPFRDRAANDRDRFVTEHTDVYGTVPHSSVESPSTTTTSGSES